MVEIKCNGANIKHFLDKNCLATICGKSNDMFDKCSPFLNLIRFAYKIYKFFMKFTIASFTSFGLSAFELCDALLIMIKG